MLHQQLLVLKKKYLLIVILIIFCILAYQQSLILKLGSARKVHERRLNTEKKSSTLSAGTIKATGEASAYQQTPIQKLQPQVHEAAEKRENPTSEKITSVLLVSQCRSGSSVVGELFNRRKGATYLYEPLYPLRTANGVQAPDELIPRSTELVDDIVHCRFHRLPEIYRQAIEATRNKDYFGCVRNGICFRGCGNGKCDAFINREAKHVMAGKSKVNLHLLGKHCLNSELFAAKLNYLPGVDTISHLVNDERLNLKIILLSRDPRAIIRSWNINVKPENRRKTFLRTAEHFCRRVHEDARFVDSTLKKFPNSTQHYLHLRHEDFAMDPLGVTKKIYGFIGKEPGEELLEWVRGSTNACKGQQNQFGTCRDSRKVVSAWRTWYKLEEVVEIQEVCGDALKANNYAFYNDKESLENLDMPSF